MRLTGPSPRNRLSTSASTYLEFAEHAIRARLPGVSPRDNDDVRRFEGKLARRFGVSDAICVPQARVGLYLALGELIEPGSEVILAPYTLTDVVNMVIFAGGRPVFADIDRRTSNIDAAEVARLLTPATGAVLVTHLHGVTAPAREIRALCRRQGVPMIEDCAQSFGLREGGELVGTIGSAGVFSFELHKTVPTLRGGAIVTDDAQLAASVRARLADFDHDPSAPLLDKAKDGLKRDVASAPVLFPWLVYPILRRATLRGATSIEAMAARQPRVSRRAPDLPEEHRSPFEPFQARTAARRLRRVDDDLASRTAHGRRYYEGLKDVDDIVIPDHAEDGSRAYLWYPVQIPDREKALNAFFECGQDVAKGHFINNADNPEFSAYRRECPRAAAVADEMVYLPTYPSYRADDIDRNIAIVRDYVASRRGRGDAPG